MDNKKLHLLALLLNLGIALYLIVFFWFIHQDISVQAPSYIMILALAYIIIEMLKKNLLKVDSHWNRLYYIGLIAIIAPVAFSDKMSLQTLTFINQVGVLFLLSPILIEGRNLLKK